MILLALCVFLPNYTHCEQLFNAHPNQTFIDQEFDELHRIVVPVTVADVPPRQNDRKKIGSLWFNTTDASIYILYPSSVGWRRLNAASSGTTLGNLAGGSSSYINNQATLQSNSTFYTTKGYINGDLKIIGEYGTLQQWQSQLNGVDDANVKLTVDATNTDFGFSEGNDFRFYAAGRYLLKIGQGTEGVIVGLTTDSSAINQILTVQGNETPLISIVQQNTDTGADSKAYVQTIMRDTGIVDRTAGRIGFQKEGTWTTASDIHSAYVIENATANALTERFRISANGNVGLSTSTPVAAFTVATSSAGNGVLFPQVSVADLQRSTPVAHGIIVQGNFDPYDLWVGTGRFNMASWLNMRTQTGPP